MPGTLDRYKGFPAIAASTLRPGEIVRLASGTTERGVCPVASTQELPFGVLDTRVGTAIPGVAVTVYEAGAIVEGLAVASMGAGAPVAIASANGGLAPLAAASGSLRHVVGDSLTPAAPGEYFELYVRPRPLPDSGAA